MRFTEALKNLERNNLKKIVCVNKKEITDEIIFTIDKDDVEVFYKKENIIIKKQYDVSSEDFIFEKFNYDEYDMIFIEYINDKLGQLIKKEIELTEQLNNIKYELLNIKEDIKEKLTL